MPFPQASFYGILDTEYVHPQCWVQQCQALLDGKAGVVQIRAKKESRRQRRDCLEAVLPLFENQTVPLILNDDLELALEYPEVGLHVGQEDVPIEEARTALGNQRYLGLSTHSPEQVESALARAHLLSYFAVGPIFSTQTKPEKIPVGLALVTYAASLKPKLPWYCIGGIKHNNYPQVKAAGAQGVVAVSSVLKAADTAAAIRPYL